MNRRWTALCAVVLSPLALAACGSDDDMYGPTKSTVPAAPHVSRDKQDDENTVILSDLTNEITWKNGVSASLSGFERGRTDQYGVPDRTRYIRFAVTITNGTRSTLDLGLVSVHCAPDSESVFDTANGLEGTPNAHVLPGEEASWYEACTADSSGPQEMQIEVTPGSEADGAWYRTAIFSGTVK